MNFKRCVIVGGADINDYQAIRDAAGDGCFYIYCDSGLKHIPGLSAKPDLIVGDFDSCKNPHLDVETIVLPTVKDDTDTVYAVKEALKRGFDSFILAGVIGARLDHSLGNVYALLNLYRLGKSGKIIDDYSEMEMVGSEPAFIDASFSFFSIINITGKAEKITIKNAKYPLENAVILPEYQYGISNEVLPGKISEVTVGCGEALLIRVRKN